MRWLNHDQINRIKSYVAYVSGPGHMTDRTAESRGREVSSDAKAIVSQSLNPDSRIFFQADLPPNRVSACIMIVS